MSENLQPEVHPDADSLSAFVEGMLPEHERAQCLAHLAECSRCREIVFLTHDAAIAPAAPIPVPIQPRRWFQSKPLLAAAAALCVILPGAWIYLHSKPGAPAGSSVARVIQPPSSTPVTPAETPAPKPAVPAAIPRSPRRSQPKPATEKPSVPEPARTSPPPTAEPSAINSLTTTQPNVPTPKPPAVVQTETATASSGISGTVIDQSGAAIPQATVQLRQLEKNNTTTARTDQDGKFHFDGLAPGQYELQINSPGFQSLSRRVELQPQEVAAVKSELQVGSTATTVEVSAAASAIDTSTAELRSDSRPLPSKLLAEITVTRGKVILSVDSAGALFFSGNSGKSWKTVKSKWPGRVVDLVTPPEVPQAQKATFQLTTDSGSIWLSRDGRRWYPAPPQH